MFVAQIRGRDSNRTVTASDRGSLNFLLVFSQLYLHRAAHGINATGSLSVYLMPDEKRLMRSTKAVYDCLTRDEWTAGHQPRRTSFVRGYSAETQAQVLANWHAYGYPKS